MLHQWEEPIISVGKGSGAIFFSHCSLKCLYCQNHEISHEGFGNEISIEKLTEIFKNLENEGACNINLVSPSHYANEIIEALKIYRPNIPIVWNTSGYEEVSTIQKIKDYVDVYLTDLKYVSSAFSKEFSGAANYFEKAANAILEMRKNQPKDVIENGLMRRGLIVRHMVLPTCAKDSISVLNWIYENLGKDTYVSLMSQYTPCYNAKKHQILKRKLKPVEYKYVLNHAVSLGLKNGFYQDFSSAQTCFIPNFKNENWQRIRSVI